MSWGRYLFVVPILCGSIRDHLVDFCKNAQQIISKTRIVTVFYDCHALPIQGIGNKQYTISNIIINFKLLLLQPRSVNTRDAGNTKKHMHKPCKI